MAAGLGFKDFVTGEVLTAADVDGYLMQGIWVFASAAARDAAVTAPQEGNFAYLKDTNVTTYYTGSAWANLDTTGMTNPMTTTGDTIYSSSGSTPARLGIGSTGQVLTVAGGVPSWATPAGGGGMTQIGTTTTFSGTTTTISSIPGTYKHLCIITNGLTATGGSYTNLSIAPNGNTSATDISSSARNAAYGQYAGQIYYNSGWNGNASSPEYGSVLWIYNYASSTAHKPVSYSGFHLSTYPDPIPFNGGGVFRSNTAVTSLDFNITGGSSANGGTITVYGVS